MNVPEVHYTRSEDVAIAYQVVGDGPMDLLARQSTASSRKVLAELAEDSERRFSSTVRAPSRRAVRPLGLIPPGCSEVDSWAPTSPGSPSTPELASPERPVRQVLVSSTVKDLVTGSGIEFEERGEHELKGVPGTWRLYAVTDA